VIHSNILSYPFKTVKYLLVIIFLQLFLAKEAFAQTGNDKAQEQQRLLLSKKQQKELILQQQQKELLEKQKQQLIEQEKSLLQFKFAKKQDEMLQKQKERDALFQKNELRSKYEASIKDKQITSQKQSLVYNSRWIAFLVIMSLLIIVIAVISFINYRKTKKLNQFIFNQNQELEQVSMVKDRVLGVVGHDMRSPLAMLISFSHLLRHGNISPEKMDAYLNQLEATLHHTSSLMDNLLYWAASQMKGYKPVTKTIQLKLVADEVLSLKQSAADNKQVSLLNKTDSNTHVMADVDMLAVVLRNLVSNAIKYTPNNGMVTIESTNQNGHVLVTVTDTGVGMSQNSMAQFNNENIQHAASTEGTSQEKGTGLGLMLCKTFTQLMNGKITVQAAQPSTGCVFKIVLPNGQS
jgi:signal transduction histidine kinase